MTWKDGQIYNGTNMIKSMIDFIVGLIIPLKHCNGKTFILINAMY